MTKKELKKVVEKISRECGKSFIVSLPEMVEMMTATKPILVEFPDVSRTVSFTINPYIAIQMLRGRMVGVSRKYDDTDYLTYYGDYLTNACSLESLVRMIAKDYQLESCVESIWNYSGFHPCFTNSIRSTCNDIVFYPYQTINTRMNSAYSVISYLKRVNATDRKVMVSAFENEHPRDFIDEREWVVISYGPEKGLVDDWMRDHNTFIDPEFEMRIMNPDLDGRKVFQYMDTHYPSKLRSYFRF